MDANCRLVYMLMYANLHSIIVFPVRGVDLLPWFVSELPAKHYKHF